MPDSIQTSAWDDSRLSLFAEIAIFLKKSKKSVLNDN